MMLAISAFGDASEIGPEMKFTSVACVMVTVAVVVVTVTGLEAFGTPPELDVVLLGPRLIRVLDETTVTATIRNVTSENRYRFQWDFGDGSNVSRWTTVHENNGSASHRYVVHGDYVVRVNASSVDGSTVSGRLAGVLVVVEPIGDVRLRLVVSSDGVHSRDFTDRITVEASTHHGSHVLFAFDFGDGRGAHEVLGSADEVTSARATHVYDRDGRYTVTVTAMNPVGNRSRSLSEPMNVRVLPVGLRLERPQYVVAAGGEATRFRATIDVAGSDVTYDWQFGNGFSFDDVGPAVSYSYPVSGTFLLNVTARNGVGSSRRVTATARVFVLARLEGVRVVVTSVWPSKMSPDAIFATDDTLEFSASVSPSPERGTHVVYYWSWSTDNDVIKQQPPHRTGRTLVGRIRRTFDVDGRYSLVVRANNSVSEVVSLPVHFRIVRRIDGLIGIQHPGSVVLGESVTFRARFWHGSDVTLRWNFGDGTEPVSSAEGRTIRNHLYNRTGEFRVSVRLTNALSSAELESVVFVLDDRCDRPRVTIVGARDDIQIRRSGILRLEAQVDDAVGIRCVASTAVNHTWMIVGTESSSSSSSVYLHGRRLTMPVSGLSVGNYTAFVKVELVGTVVYATAQARFQVLSERNSARIEGGTGRVMGQSETAVLVGNTIANSSLRWTCIPLENIRSDCFSSATFGAANMRSVSTSRLVVPASDLDRRFASFLFTLTARHPVAGLARAGQVIEIGPAAKALSLMVTCHSCTDDGVVFRQDAISLSARCRDCSADTVYEWQVWLVQDGNENLPISDHDCVNPDGSTFFLNASTSTPIASGDDHDDEADDLFLEGRASMVNVTPSKEDVGVREPVDFLEGFAGEAGSAPARGFLNERLADSNPEVGSVSTDVDLAVAASKPSYSREWKFVRMDEDDVVIGVNSSVFIVKPEVLRVGRTYVFVVLAHGGSADAHLEGKASQQVRVSFGPTNGRCSLMPLVGREYETTFKLDCYEWKPESVEGGSTAAVFYELSYTPSDATHKVLVYYGLNNDFEFVLPAGNDADEIKLDVVVWQESGSNTIVCSISRTVLPLSRLSSSVTSRVLSRELSRSLKSNISVGIDWSDFGSALNRIHVLASLLNGGEVRDRTTHRTRLLKFVFKVKPTSAAESLQLLNAIDEIYRQPCEVDLSLMRSSLKAVRRAAKWYWSPDSTCEPFCSHGLRALFDVTGSILDGALGSDIGDQFGNRNRNGLLESALAALQTALAARLSAKNDDSVKRFRARALTVDAVCADVDSRNRTVGPDSVLVTFDGSPPMANAACRCLQAIASRAVYGSATVGGGSREVYSAMVSLRISSCDTRIWSKESDVSAVSVVIPRAIGTDVQNLPSSVTRHTLSSRRMNVHGFTVPTTFGNNSVLSAAFRFDASRLLSAVLVLVSAEFPPSVENSFRRARASMSSEAFVLSFGGHQLEGGRTYHVAIVDAAFEQPVTSRFEEVEYSVDVLVVGCLQWNFITNSWSASGCRVGSTEPTEIRCRCDRLTSYTSTWRSLETVLRVSSLDHLIGLRLNLFVPVILVLFLVVHLVGLVLTSRNSKDRRRVHRCGAVYLDDNSPADRHLYKVNVQTGYRSGSGTTAKVYIVLHGENGMTEPRELTAAGGRKEESRSTVFRLGSLDTFLLTSPSDLGRIFKVQLWHDNSELDPSWFLDHVTVRNVSSGSWQYFGCRKWFAVERDDGAIEREIHVCEDGPSFRNVVRSNFEALRHYTGWPRMWKRVDSAHFTHDDRMLSSILSVAIVSLLAAIWCSRNSFEVSVLLERLQPSFLVLGISSCLAAVQFAVPLFLAITFRFTRLLSCLQIVESSASEKPKPTSVMTKDADKCADVNSEFSLALDEPIENFNKLQEWAERQWARNVAVVCSGSSSASTGVVPSTAVLKGSDFMLPVTFRYFVWILCILAAIFASIVSAAIGIKFSSELGYVWLQIVLLSVAVDVAVFGPIANAVGAVVLAVLRKETPLRVRSCRCRCGSVSSAIAIDPTSTVDRFTAKQRSRELRFARPPAEKHLLKYKKSARKAIKMDKYLEEFVTSVFVLIVLVGIVFSREDVADVYRLNRHLDRVFARTRTMPLSEVSSTAEWFRWMHEEFYDVVYRKESNNERLYVRGTTSVLLGSARLSRSDVFGRMAAIQNRIEIRLPDNETEFAELMDQLREDDWLHENNTSGLTISLVLYNVPTKIFSSVKLNFRLISGSSSIDVDSMLLSAPTWPSNVVSAVLKCLLLTWLLWKSSSVARERLFEQHDSLGFWKIVQLVYLVTLIVYFVIHYRLEVALSRIADGFERSKHDGNDDVTSAIILKRVYDGLIGLAVILHLTSSLRLLRVSPIFVRIAWFIRTFLRPLSIAFVGVCVVLISFACLGSASFGPRGLTGFETPFKAVQYLFELLTGSDRLDRSSSGFHGALSVFAIAFLVAVLVLLINQAKYIVEDVTESAPIRPRCTDDFTVKDLFEVLRNRIHSTFTREVENRNSSRLPIISVEFILAELESQVEAMYVLTSELVSDVNDDSRLDDDVCAADPTTDRVGDNDEPPPPPSSSPSFCEAEHLFDNRSSSRASGNTMPPRRRIRRTTTRGKGGPDVDPFHSTIQGFD